MGQRCFEDGRAQTKEQTRNSLDVDKSRDMDPLQSLQQEHSSVNISTVARWNAFWTAHCQHWRVMNLLEFITGKKPVLPKDTHEVSSPCDSTAGLRPRKCLVSVLD